MTLTNHRHLTEPVAHYTPTANGSKASRRVAVCGAETVLAGPYLTPPEPLGISRIELVTCCVCLEKAREANRAS
jgi:hypothetical protein